MSLYEKDQPAALARFRANTLNQAKMAGITMPGFFCQKCKKHKAVSGRKRVVPHSSKFGYVCRECSCDSAA